MIAGVVDETANFEVLGEITGRVELYVSAVRRFNSLGVRQWADAMRALSRRAELVFVECSRAVIQQASMIAGFLGSGVVVSFHAPMHCEACDLEEDYLVTTDEVRRTGRLPEVACVRCRHAMQLDGIEDVYLHFLREP